MTVKTLQRSFAAGEIAPELYGRLDLARYQTGLALARNFEVLPHGPARNRAGFEYTLETKDSTKRSIVVPFSFNDQQTYAIELGDHYARFYTQGATLLEAAVAPTGISVASPAVWTRVAHGFSAGNWLYVLGVTGTLGAVVNGRFLKVGTVPTVDTFTLTDLAGVAINSTGYTIAAFGTVARVYEIATPYAEADLPALHFAQSADVLTITHGSYPQAELSRLSATSWTYAATAFTNGPFLDAYSQKRKYLWTTDVNGVLPPLNSRDGTTGDVSIYSDDDLFTSADVGRLLYVGASRYIPVTTWGTGLAYSKGSYVRYGSNYYVAVNAGTTGTVPPTHTSGIQTDFNTGAAGVYWLYLDGRFGTAKITEFVSTKRVKASVQTTLPLSIQFGFVNAAYAHVPVMSWTLSGTGVQTQFSIAGAAGIGSDLAYNYRVFVGGLRQVPHEEYEVNSTTDQIDFFTAPAAGVNNVLVEQFTAGIFTVDFAFGAWGTTPGYPAAVSYFGGRIGYAGSTQEPQDVWLSAAGAYKDFGNTPLLADDEAINVTVADQKVNQVRDLVPLKNLVAMTSSRAWALIGDVNNVLTPAATADPGTAVGISTVQAEVVGAQALYVESSGSSVRKLRFGALADGTEGYVSDDVSLLAEHLFRGLTIVDIAFQQRPYPYLWCVRSDGVLLGLTYSPEHDVVGWHRHDTDGFFESVAVIREGSEDVPYVTVRRTVNGRSVRYVERLRSRRFSSLAACYHVDSGLTYSGAPATIISGLWHLEGRTVVALADGAVVRDLVVTGGQVTLPAAASVVHVGLSYASDLQTLPLSLQAQAFGQGTLKNIDQVLLRVVESSHILAGPAFDQLREYKQRTDEPYGTPPRVISGEIAVDVMPDWNRGGAVCLRQDDPLPITVSAMTLTAALEDG